MGGTVGWRTPFLTDNVKAIVAFEPGGSPFLFPEGEVPAISKAVYAPVSAQARAVPLADFEKLTKIPLVLYYGDNIAAAPTTEVGPDKWRSEKEVMIMKFSKTVLAGLIVTGLMTAGVSGAISAMPAEAAAKEAPTTQGIAFFGARDLKEIPLNKVKSPNSNPFGLVYRGAITKNEAGKVNIHPVTYNLNGNLDNPAFRTEDIHGMVDIIASFPGVDPERIGALGICGGGGYTLKASQTDKRIKAVATLSMFNSGIVRRDGFLNAAKATTQQRLAEASAQRAKEAAGGETARTPGMEEMDVPEAELAKMPTLYSEGYLYCGKTHRHPNSTFKYTVRSNLDLFTFDAADNMALLNQPLLMMAGSKADTLYMTEDAFKKATGTENKELFLIPGASHIQTYWVPEYVDAVLGKLVPFYQKNL
jgi:fermentation-respiration switch protein FrsA (DUF1100 family)